MPDGQRVGGAWIQVTPSLVGFNRSIRQQLKRELAGVRVDVEIGGDFDGLKRDATREGADAGGNFAQSFRRRVEAALKALPDVKIGADSSEAQREIAEIRRELLTLSEKTVGVDLDATEATAQIARLRARLEQLGAQHVSPDVDVDVAAATAQLAAIDRQVDRLDGRRANVSVDVDQDGSAQRASFFLTQQVNSLVLAGFGIAPVFVPAFAAAAAGAVGLAAAVAGAGAGVGALAAVSLPALSAVSDAVKATEQAEKSAATSAVTGTRQRVQAAYQAEQAAERVADAQRSADRTAVEGARRVEDAQRALGDTRRQVADQVDAANERLADSERALERAHDTVRRAQEDLTRAREDAIRTLQDLREASSDLVLSEEGAEITLIEARQRLSEVERDATATALDRRKAVLQVAEAEDRLSDVRRDQRRTSTELAAAERAGVNGSEQVLAANERLSDASQGLADARRDNIEAQRDLVRAEADGARAIADAEREVSDARQQAAEANADAARAVGDALEAQARQAEMANLQTEQGTAGARNLAFALGQLTPLQRQLYDGWLRLQDAFQGWARSLEPAVIPLFLQGMGLIEQVLPRLTPLVVASADAFGFLLDQAQRALGSPFWQSFFDFLARVAGPAIEGFGLILGNVAHGFAGILMAFEDFSLRFTGGLVEMSERFAEWGENLGDSPGFRRFTDYVNTVWPPLKETIKAVGRAFGTIVEALAPLGGGPVLSIIRGIANTIAGMDPQHIRDIAGGIAGIALAMKAIGFVTAAASLGPWGLALLAVAAIVVWAYTRFEGFRDVVAGVIDWFRDTAIPRLQQFGEHLVGVFEDHIRPVLEDFGVWFQEEVVPVIQWFADTFVRKGKEVVDWFERNWPAIQDAIGTFIDYVEWKWNNILFPVFSAIVWVLRNVVGPAILWLWHDVVEPGFKAIAAVISFAWHYVIKPVFMAIDWFIDNVLVPAFSWLHGSVVGAWNGIRDGIAAAWRFIRDKILLPIGNFLNDRLIPAFRQARDTIVEVWRNLRRYLSNIWNDILRAAGKAVNFVIDIINDITGAIEDIAGHLGFDIEGNLHINPVKWGRVDEMQAGGAVDPNRSGPFVTNGPRAIVGEGSRSHPEYVIPTDPKFRGRALGLFEQLGGHLMARGGVVPQMQAGGIIGGGVDFVQRIVDAASGLGNVSLDWLKGIGTWLKDEAIAWVRENVISPVVGSAGGIARAYQGAVGGGVERWRETALQALRMTGSPLSWINSLLRRMNQESGGNPNAINRWDDNARRGDPTMGLMQNIPSAYPSRVAGFPSLRNTSPFHPLGSIVASIVYANQRYGAAPIGWDRPGGYAMGGVLPFLGSFQSGLDRVPHDGIVFAHRDEAILNASDAEMFRQAGLNSVKERPGLPPIMQTFNGITDPSEIARTTGDELAWQVTVGSH